MLLERLRHHVYLDLQVTTYSSTPSDNQQQRYY
jgi:hypothetical protein